MDTNNVKDKTAAKQQADQKVAVAQEAVNGTGIADAKNAVDTYQKNVNKLTENIKHNQGVLADNQKKLETNTGDFAFQKSLVEFRALWARKGLKSFSAAACTSPKILLAKRASNWPPLAVNRGAERSAGLHRPLAAGGLYCQKRPSRPF